MNLTIPPNQVHPLTRDMTGADVGYTPAQAEAPTDPTSPRALGLPQVNPHLTNPYAVNPVNHSTTHNTNLSHRAGSTSSGSGERATPPHHQATPTANHNHVSMPGGVVPTLSSALPGLDLQLQASAGLPSTSLGAGSRLVSSASAAISTDSIPSPSFAQNGQPFQCYSLTPGAAGFNPYQFMPPMRGGMPTMPVGRRYPCKLCTATFEHKAELQIHTQVHMREAKPYKCTHCPKSFANSSYLSQHMRIHLGIKPFGPCQYCARKFTQLSHLQQHLRTHTGEKPYKCRYPGCEKAFSQLSNLQSHSRCHQSDKPYKCNSCYKCFTDEQSLLDHIPKHKESKHIKVHLCPYCGKSYTQATYLAKHMTKHTDRRDRDLRIREITGAGLEPTWPRGEVDLYSSLGQPSSTDPTVNLPFNTAFPGSNLMAAQTQVTYPSMASTNPSAFTHLAGLTALGRGGLSGSSSASARGPYFPYDNYKSATAHPSGLAHGASSYHNSLIRLDEIQSYARQVASSQSEPFSSMLGVKRDPIY